MPKHRTQRREDRPGRGVPADDASFDEDTAEIPAQPADEIAEEAAAGRAVRPAGRPAGRRRMRGLLVTPWFAASAGILIAATVALEAPRHAVLSYGPVNPGVLCKNVGCTPGRSPGSLATAKPGVELTPSTAPDIAAAPPASDRPTPAPASKPPPAPSAPPDITLHFVVVRHENGGFLGIITMQSQMDLGHWSLGFTIPGTRISSVLGGQWQPSATGDGGVATGDSSAIGGVPGGAIGGAAVGQGGSGGQDGSGGQNGPLDQAGAGMAKIVIVGTGTPRSPTGCIFDGKHCAFS